jgi:glutaredoxin
MEEDKLAGETEPEKSASATPAPEPETAAKPSADNKLDKKKTKKLNKKFIAILAVVVIIVVAYSGYMNGKFDKQLDSNTRVKLDSLLSRNSLSTAQAGDIINSNFMKTGESVTVKEVTQDYGLFKIKFEYSGQEYTAYLTSDKKLFFPEAYDLQEMQKQKADAAAAAVPTKSDKPVVELFVMSHCPYGTQMEKAIIPVIKTLGSKIDFKLKFCDYSMHGDEELAEELNQYCISQNQPDKLISYLECFLQDKTGSAKCQAQVGIDSAKLKTCVAATDSQYKITENSKNKDTYQGGTYPSFPIFESDVSTYQVSGSPTLVINSKQVTSNRDSADLLKTICASFNNAPAECSQTLDSTTPPAGFGNAAASGSNTSGTGSCQ